MGLEIVIVGRLFEPIADAPRFVLGDQTAQVLQRQDQAMLVSAIVRWTNTVFNSEQIGRLVQEFRALVEQRTLDHRARMDLTEAADFIDSGSGGESHRFVVFLGD